MVSNEPLTTRYAGSVAEIDLAVMSRNLELLKREARTGQVMAVVKADAYGHGAIAVSRHIEEQVAAFAVAAVDEGIQLRRAGIERPILVFGVPDGLNREAYRRFGLTATVSHSDHFSLLPPGTHYQLNFDTGMRRLGLYPEQAGAIREEVESQTGLICTGVYSHFAEADEPASPRVAEQLDRFMRIRENLSLDVPYHMSNTAAVMHYDLPPLDMIRIGLGLAGYTPGVTQHEGLQPALCWKTRISQCRHINAGDRVGYGGRWTAPHNGYLLTVPAGYADGIPRSLSNRLQVRVGGEWLSQVGSITMDHMMLFSPDLPVSAGTEVVMMGGEAWRANRWAEEAGSITHEIFCRLTSRVRRNYIHGSP